MCMATLTDVPLKVDSLEGLCRLEEAVRQLTRCHGVCTQSLPLICTMSRR